MDLASTLRDEVAVLERQLKADARVRKLIYLYALLREYDTPPHTPMTLPDVSIDELGHGGMSTLLQNTIGRPRNARAREKDIVDAVVTFLQSNGPAHRMDILDTLAKQHLITKDRFGMRLLAVYLTKAPQVQSIGNGVWRLADEAQQSKAG